MYPLQVLALLIAHKRTVALKKEATVHLRVEKK